ncbi:hypothetical protein D3C71_1561300 [compost metagenome]
MAREPGLGLYIEFDMGSGDRRVDQQLYRLRSLGQHIRYGQKRQQSQQPGK